MLSNEKASRYLRGHIFISILILMTVVMFSNVENINNEWTVLSSFILNGVIIYIALLKPYKLGHSLWDIMFLFMLIFMFLGPFIQYLAKKFPWWDTHLIDNDLVFKANITILIFMIIFIIGYYITKKVLVSKSVKSEKIKNIKSVLNILYILTILSSLFIITNTGFSNLFSRLQYSVNIESSALSLIVTNTFRAIPVIYTALNIKYLEKNKKAYKVVPFFIGALLMILINFPIATARFWMASVYLGLLVLLVRKIKNPYLFKIIIIVGIFVVFPYVNIFRNNSFFEAITMDINLSEPSRFLLSGDFNAFSMLTRGIHISDLNGVAMGSQLLGNIFFFIPRVIWPSKPVGSGYTVASLLGWDFKNVSMPFVAEGYINFGFIGVILFALILSFLCSYADMTYFNSTTSKQQGNVYFIELIYPFSLGFLFFILRGDLLSSVSYYIGFMVPVIAIWAVQNLFKKNKKI